MQLQMGQDWKNLLKLTVQMIQMQESLLEHIYVKHIGLIRLNHKNSPGCKCDLCQELKEKGDKWIYRMDTLHHPYGLNSRDKIKQKSRGTCSDSTH